MKAAIERINEYEIPFCRFFNRVNRKLLVNRFFSLVSRLGDGLIWYVIMIILPVIYGEKGFRVTVGMILTGASGVLIYKLMKTSTRRCRPYSHSRDIIQGVRALDQFSFPSGHTLHASAFATVLSTHFPAWTWPAIVFAGLVALSRLVLGLHYPSDVLIGGLIGYYLALCSFAVLA